MMQTIWNDFDSFTFQMTTKRKTAVLWIKVSEPVSSLFSLYQQETLNGFRLGPAVLEVLGALKTLPAPRRWLRQSQ